MIKIRCCINCKTRNNKDKLLRIVACENKNAILDEKQNINQRAIYICNNKSCIDSCIKAIKKGKFKTKIDVNPSYMLELLYSIRGRMEE